MMKFSKSIAIGDEVEALRYGDKVNGTLIYISSGSQKPYLIIPHIITEEGDYKNLKYWKDILPPIVYRRLEVEYGKLAFTFWGGEETIRVESTFNPIKDLNDLVKDLENEL